MLLTKMLQPTNLTNTYCFNISMSHSLACDYMTHPFDAFIYFNQSVGYVTFSLM